MLSFLCFLLVMCTVPAQAGGFANELRLRGYSLIPAPQIAELSDTDFELDNTWRIDSPLSGDNIAVRTLRKEAEEFVKNTDLYERARKIGMSEEMIATYPDEASLKSACDRISPQTNPDARVKIAKPKQKDWDFISSPFRSAAIVATEMQTRLGYTFYIVP